MEVRLLSTNGERQDYSVAHQSYLEGGQNSVLSKHHELYVLCAQDALHNGRVLLELKDSTSRDRYDPHSESNSSISAVYSDVGT